MSAETRVVSTRSALWAAYSAGGVGERRAVVMTMGALHEGHATLVREARSLVGAAGCVIVTDFVNPTQFGAGEDFERYPRTLERDAELAAEAGAEVLRAGGSAVDAAEPGTPTLSSHLLHGAARPRCGLVRPAQAIDASACDWTGPLFEGRRVHNAATPADPANPWQGVSGAVALDADANRAHATVISAPGARVPVLVLPTNEERVVAQGVRRVLAQG